MENPNLIKCHFNQEAAPFSWIMQTPTEQGYNNTHNQGTVGIFSAMNRMRSDVVDTESFLIGKDQIISRCNPPVSDGDNRGPFMEQKQEDLNKLRPLYTKEKKSALNTSSISFIPFNFAGYQFFDPQDTDHIIFNESVRGGLVTSNDFKDNWSLNNKRYFY